MARNPFDHVQQLIQIRQQANEQSAPPFADQMPKFEFGSALGGESNAFAGPGGTQAPKGNLQTMAQHIARQYGWDQGVQWNALVELVNRESSWNNTAQNPTSTAYGLFQFLDSTWGGTGFQKTSDPKQQIMAGLRYIQNRYGSPLAALQFHNNNNWY